METLKERVDRLQAEGIYLGGLPENFESGGRKQIITLLSQGMNPNSKVLDIGCGCLRGGYWCIHFLDEGCYFGIEPNIEMLNGGIRILLEPGLMESKKPRFDNNEVFDFAVFGEKFDFFVARSIWSHASKPQIQQMLDGFVSTAKPESIFITSYLRPTIFKPDYKGATWVGRCHKSSVKGFVHHSLSWIRKECAQRGLDVEEIRQPEYNYFHQIWLRIAQKSI
jgi:hypothetical protein